MNYVRLIAPAKINLVLAVGAKQPGGYHAVDTVMHTLALHDTLVMRRFEEDEGGLAVALSCEGTEGIELDVAPEDNLAYKAVFALAAALGREDNEKIEMSLVKSIPLQAGLGGGSSDAAAALLGAAALWDVSAEDPRILEVACGLGSDVPFFLQGGCAVLTGRGDQLQRALEPTKRFCVLVRPEGGVSTAQAYERFDQAPECLDADFVAGLTALSSADQVPVVNNLTAAAKELLPELAQVEQWVAQAVEEAPGCQGVLCGSGAAYAVLCDSYDQAVALSVAASKEGWATRVTSLFPVGATVVEGH